jgi:hypothetical protein
VPGLGELGHTEELARTVLLVVEDLGYVYHPEPVRRTLDDLDLVTGLERPFCEDPQVDAVATGIGEASGEPVVSYADAELVAGDAGLGDPQDHAPHLPALADDRL